MPRISEDRHHECVWFDINLAKSAELKKGRFKLCWCWWEITLYSYFYSTKLSVYDRFGLIPVFLREYRKIHEGKRRKRATAIVYVAVIS